MKKTFCLILLLTLCLRVVLNAQINLVNNSGFEQYSGCTSGSGQWNLCQGWDNVNMSPGPGPWGTPDYYVTCGINNTAPPSTFAGNCPTHGGNAMMSLVVYNMGYANYREYLSTQLKCNMQAGKTYTVSFWISNGTTNISPWTIKNFGICLSNGPLTQNGWGVVNANPQLEVNTNIVSQGWTQYSAAITPTASLNRLTIGVFKPDSQTNPTLSWPNLGGPASAYANYFIDDIEVLAPPTQIQVTTSNTLVCKGSTVNITASGANTYSWSTGSTGNTILVTPNTTTSYTVTGYSTDECSAPAKSVITIALKTCETGLSDLNDWVPIQLLMQNSVLALNGCAVNDRVIIHDINGKLVCDELIGNNEQVYYKDFLQFQNGLYSLVVIRSQTTIYSRKFVSEN